MKRDAGVFFEDILESINAIESYTKNIKEEKFSRDTKLQDAVVRRLEIIGEAVKHIPVSIKRKHPEIPWKKISGTRDVLIHEYFGVNMARVWFTVKNDIIPLKKKIELLLKKFS